jgi:hypothetical protein
MRPTVVAAAALTVGVCAVWLSSSDNSAPSVPPTSTTPTSMWEMHSMAHLEFFPVRPIEDQTVVFHQVQR